MTTVEIHVLSELIVGAPLIAALVAGFGCRVLPRNWVDKLTTLAVGFSFLTACCLWTVLPGHDFKEVWTLYQWAAIGSFDFHIGFWMDSLTVLMLMVVTFVSLMVHIYTMGYMAEDPGYSRFFSYIALFTFAMLMLVMSDNFLQLFFGWEAVGLVSYLLIGFWTDRPSAVFANLKAFLVNRLGDFGFLLGIALVFLWCHSVDYAVFFEKLQLPEAPLFRYALFTNCNVSLLECMGILLFIGAMGKSAQVPLHVWLPDSMEGPTPISALIHAATMVTAGVFMVARMAPLYEHAEVARSFILIVGACTAFFMGWVGVVQNDIKRIIAYSTLSQLGYMVVALGVGAYSLAIFHLTTHAFFKALLFLGAGSVIMGMHHEQDIQKMGGLMRKMPVTYLTMLVGTLALVGFPFFSGFYSKDLIIEAVHHAHMPGATFAYWAVLGGVWVTSVYSFRCFFLVFHTRPRMDARTLDHVHESPWVVKVPLIALAILAVFSGLYAVKSLALSSFLNLPQSGALQEIIESFHSPLLMALEGFYSLPFLLVCLGFLSVYLCYEVFPQIPLILKKRLSFLNTLLDKKYYFDDFNQNVLIRFIQALGQDLNKWSEVFLIDGCLVNGTSNRIGRLSELLRKSHTGYLYHSALFMVLGVLILIACFLWRTMG